ncbi:MAG TPA: TonB-dependent receptor [Vicinamibacterales bacterium]|nr:TonB-dependent receptor [Vicinamibacterales bacterium]
MRNLVSRWCFLALLFVPLATSAAWAQTFTGGVRGVVTDSGGVVPGVTVTLINEANGASRDAVSNERGLYDFAAVNPGVYTVKAELTGFKTFENKGVRVGTQQFVTMDIKLDVGQLQETITVTGEAPLIDTSNASTGAIIDSKQLESLPSAGRSAFLFAVTVPTVVASGDAQFNRQQDQTNASLLSMGGGARRGNNYLVDGVPITDMRNRASANPTIEALEGVNVQVHQYDAETGRTGGGTFNVATKSGGNDFHGSGFYQTRPVWGAVNNFFSELAGQPKPNTYFHEGGGGFGGPVIKNRTFFWVGNESYGSNTTRNGNLRFPTTRELAGDFSQSFDGSGRLIVIYDPLTGDPATGLGRQPFPNNTIPANRLNPVSVKMASYLPKPDTEVANGSANRVRTAEINDRAQMYTAKLDHRISDQVSLNGFYLYNRTNEPCANYWEPGLSGENRFADPGDYILRRRVNLLTLNNTWLPSNNTVLTFRYGFNTFKDNNTLSIDFDPATLGFPSSFLGALDTKKFPQVTVTDYVNPDFTRLMGAIDPVNITWHSWAANAAVSKLLGRHTVKIGADYRLIGLDFQSFAGAAGDFRFDRRFTSADPNVNGVNGATPSGNAFAAFLLGYPSGDPGNQSRVAKSTPLNLFTNYYGLYAQDDFRVNSKLTLNYGVRLEHEDGLQEENNNITVAFDRGLQLPGAYANAVNPLTGQRITGGLVYAGQNGANDYQGNPPSVKFSPRVGIVYAMSPKSVVRSGYGVYWAPWNYQAPSNTNYGQIGAANTTFTPQSLYVPSVTLSNPFPSGLLAPTLSSLGALTGLGGQIEFIDQDKKAPYVHMYSFDYMRELAGGMAVGFEYSGATGRDLGLGGSNDGILNINQVPYTAANLALTAAQLNEQLPNPYLGLTQPAGTSLNTTSATLPRRQLLRPFPQFGDILMRQNTQGKSQYHAGILKFEKRVTNGWGGRINYTYSRLKDNQFAESNFFSRASTEAQDANNIEAEYAVSLLDVPHKLVMSPIVELPFGEGKKWLQGGVGGAILGNWTLSAIIGFESGFPMALRGQNNLSALGGRTQWVNINGDFATEGSREERIIGTWLSPTNLVQPTANQLGTGGRTQTEVRTPDRNNVDFVATKSVPIKGSVRGEFRLELLNLMNEVKVRGPIEQLGSSTFGQIRVQSAFMRLTQLTFRVTF